VGARGPLPDLSIVRGRRGRRQPAATPSTVPKPPEWITGTARAEWERVSPSLEAMGAVSECDTALLIAYTTAVEMWTAVQLELRRLADAAGTVADALTTTSDTGVVHPHPLLAMSHTLATDAVRWAGELGLTPAGRARLRLKVETEPVDEHARKLRALMYQGDK
jgi:P27 family predicted phage terminase small subunit